MTQVKPDIPAIGITGSSGKTTTREILSSILEQKWKVLKNTGNKNLPTNTQQIAESYDSTIDAIVLELGMGKPGAGKIHCSYLQPNISIITNIGTAHYGNLGNSIRSTAENKSALIKYMKQDGLLLLNEDDDNSKLLDTSTFKGEIITIGINKHSDYQASDIQYVQRGMKFKVKLDNKEEPFFIPTFGEHMIYNTLFAVALSHQLGFTASEIRTGLENFQMPIKRLNIIELQNQSILIDDTVNANPQSVKAAFDVQEKLGRGKKRIVVLGSMLELGDYSDEGHIEVGAYLADKKADAVFTYGRAAKLINKGLLKAGYPPEKVKHFNSRDDLHRELKRSIEANSVILVKGSSAMNMNKTVSYIKDRFFYSITINPDIQQKYVYLNSQTLERIDPEAEEITLHFGQLQKNLKIIIDNELEAGQIIIPQNLTKLISIPSLPYEYYFINNHLHLGPVIGMIVYTRYMNDPSQQLQRFADYENIKGLIYLFFPKTIDKWNKTISGCYYDPEKNSFVDGVFPFPNVIFNRIPLRKSRYDYLKKEIGDKIFNYPYGNTDKFDFWKLMYKQPVIKNYLPKTKKLENVTGVLKALEYSDSVYLKPVSMAGGNGIFHLKKMDDGYKWTDIEGKTVDVKDKKGLSEILRKQLIPKKEYIIQEEILTFNKDQNKLDFRIYLQKDYSKKWRYSGLETKVGKKDSIIANSQNREKIIPGEQALREFYGLSKEEAKRKVEEITNVCILTLKVMEAKGYKLGDACLDLVMDKNKKFWILEVQINYAAEIKAFRDEGERRILPFILPTPFEYAKALADF